MRVLPPTLAIVVALLGAPAAWAQQPTGTAPPAAAPAVPPAASNPPAPPPAATAAPPAPAVPAASPTPAEAGGDRPALPNLSAPAATPTAAADQAAPPSGPAIGNLPQDLSPVTMFMHADIVVKAVMIGLAFASLVTWTIWLAKSLQLIGARRRELHGVRALLKASDLLVLEQTRGSGPLKAGPVAALVHAAFHELQRSADLPPEGTKERAAIALQRVEARAARAMNQGTGLIATIGSTAPFVGLFGTVWGIMNSFVGISRAHTTNLAVVAPGIAEALLATAIGLVAAIPAVIIYNAFARSIAGYKVILADASAEVLRHLSRDLDRRHHASVAE